MKWVSRQKLRKAAFAVCFVVAMTVAFMTPTQIAATAQTSPLDVTPLKKPAQPINVVPEKKPFSLMDSLQIKPSQKTSFVQPAAATQAEDQISPISGEELSDKSDDTETAEESDEGSSFLSALGFRSTSSALEIIPIPQSKPGVSEYIARDVIKSDVIPMPAAKPTHEKSLQRISERDRDLYKQIFKLQENAEWRSADELYTQLSDFRLRGHLRYQRLMHPTGYRANFSELKNWMDLYNDHPNAHKVYKLAMARVPKDYKGHVKQPERMTNIRKTLHVLDTNGDPYTTAKKRSYSQKQAIRTLSRRIDHDLSNGAPSRAYLKLRTSDTTPYLDETEYDRLKAKIAKSYMHAGKLDKALELATESAQRSGVTAPLAGWVAGLVYWRTGNYREATGYFETTAVSPYASAWTQAAGAYWASRAHFRSGHIRDVNKWLEKAAHHPRTFYGLIAARSLGWRINFNWDIPEYREHHEELLQSIPAARRALALVDIGQYHLAEQELRRLDMNDDPFLRESLLAFAYKTGLASLAMRMAEAYEHPSGGLYDAGLFPICPWEPEGGYTVDRALIHALIKQESRFNPLVESHSGAVGLMQLMPKTATYVAKDRRYLNRAGQHTLKNPQTNLDIGQRYISALLSGSSIDTELFSLVIAYNAGPGNLRKWKREFADMRDDPLLFIESIPMSETRAFLERVMANYWIYRHRFNQPTPSLDAVAGGRWAHYVQLDNKYEPQMADERSRTAHKYSSNAPQAAQGGRIYRASYNN